MKRLLLMAAFSISLLTLLAACGGSSSEDESSTQDGASSQEITSGATIEPTNTGDPGVVALSGSDAETDHDAEVQIYLG
jgi:ABC-type glycerol-3-phosphate transport system substrate-binding protein